MFLPPHPTLSMPPPHMPTSALLMPHMSPNSPLTQSSNSQPSTLSSLPLRPAYNVESTSGSPSPVRPSRRALGAVIREAKDGTLTILSSTAIPTAIAVSKTATKSHSHDVSDNTRTVGFTATTVDVDGTTTNRVDLSGRHSRWVCRDIFKHASIYLEPSASQQVSPVLRKVCSFRFVRVSGRYIRMSLLVLNSAL